MNVDFRSTDFPRCPERRRHGGVSITRTALDPQFVVSQEIAILHERAESGETQPRLDVPPYRSSLLRHPTNVRQRVDPEDVELVAPVFGQADVNPVEAGRQAL